MLQIYFRETLLFKNKMIKKIAYKAILVFLAIEFCFVYSVKFFCYFFNNDFYNFY